MIRIFLLSSVLFFCHSVLATQKTYNHIEITKISKSDTWLKLLVYDDGQSFIKAQRFFLSEHGNVDPSAELIATLDAFAESQQSNTLDAHPQCKFASRYAWLKNQLDFDQLGITEVYCPSFRSFTKNQNIKSVSLIFATGFLSNPASYYGHLLVKLNSENDKLNDLQNTTINFGADVPLDENMALYVLKGITGGYDSSFTSQQYFLHAAIYGESELRDLWEYELALTPQDITLLLGHIWELLDIDYQYYFFNRNCAFHIGQLLQLVLQNKLTDSSRLWVTPQAIMQNLANSTYHERPLVKEIKYHPSRQSKLYQRFSILNEQQKKTLNRMILSSKNLNLLHLQDFNLHEQQQIIDTLIDYFQLLRKADKDNATINNENYKQALLLRYSLPTGTASTEFVSNQHPHLGRKPSLTSIQLMKNSQVDSFTKIQIRPAYYDALDAQEGHVRYSALSMAELHLGFSPNEIYIKDFSLFKIESIRANLTGLPGDQHHSWYLDIGTTQENLGCIDCTANKVSSGIGYAFQSMINFNVSGFVGVGYLGRNININNSYLAARVVSTWYVTDKIATNIDTEYRRFKTGETQQLFQVATRYSLSTNTEMRLSLAKDRMATEVGLSLGWYW